MQIIPAVDVLDGRVVRLLKGDYRAVADYGADPAATARDWWDRGAPLVHVVDLGGARSGEADTRLAATLAASGARFQLGGGLRSVAAVQAVLDAGADRAVVGSVAVWDPALLVTMVHAAGPERLVVAIDVSAGRVATAGWEQSGPELCEVLAGVTGAGVRAALVTGIARDGTMAGPDLDLLARVREQAPTLDVIASGGVGSLQHLRDLANAGLSSAIVGKALYEGRFTLEDAIAAVE